LGINGGKHLWDLPASTLYREVKVNIDISKKRGNNLFGRCPKFLTEQGNQREVSLMDDSF